MTALQKIVTQHGGYQQGDGLECKVCGVRVSWLGRPRDGLFPVPRDDGHVLLGKLPASEFNTEGLTEKVPRKPKKQQEKQQAQSLQIELASQAGI